MNLLTIILVLGTQYSELQFERAEVGIKLLKKTPSAIILFAGGKKTNSRGHSEVYSEGARMLRSAFRHRNLDPNKALVETFSKNTAQNAMCAPVIWKSACLQPDTVIVVTHKFHLSRARKIFESAWHLAPWSLQFETVSDPEDVEWRAKLEIELMKNVQLDLQEARRLKSNCSRQKSCLHLTKGVH